MLGIHWGLAEKDTSSAEGLISSVYVFFLSLSLCLHYLHLSIHLYLPLFFPALLIPPIGIVRLDVKLWYNIY